MDKNGISTLYLPVVTVNQCSSVGISFILNTCTKITRCVQNEGLHPTEDAVYTVYEGYLDKAKLKWDLNEDFRFASPTIHTLTVA